MASNDINQVTIVLGDEFDESLRAKLLDVFRELGATQAGDADRFVVGSQDVEAVEVTIDGRRLQVEAETYIGLSLSGPADLVEKIRRLVLQ